MTPEHLHYNKKFRVADKDIARLRLNLSHLNEHKFGPNLKDMINPMCKCSPDMLILKQIFIAFCAADFIQFTVQRVKLLNGVYKLDSTLQNSSDGQLLTALLCGSEKFTLNVNKVIKRLTINFLNTSGRFVQLLF